MTHQEIAEQFVEQLYLLVPSKKRESVSADPDPGQEDLSIGVPMGKIFALAKEFIEMPPVEIEKLLESPIHDVRVGAVSIMDWQARSKKTTE